MGVDGLAGGSPDDIWQKVQSEGREIYVMINGSYNGTGFYSGYAFNTYIVTNLPESDIVGSPQSVMHEVEGGCEVRRYQLLGSLFFAGKNRSGMAMDSTPAENIERKLVPNSPFEKAFNMLCKIAKEKKPQVLTPDLTPAQMVSRDEAAFRNLSKNWRNVTASDGQVYEVAMDTISRKPSDMWPPAVLRAATAYVYGPLKEPFNSSDVQRFFFDCHNHFQTFKQDWSPVADILPQSVAAKVASIACDNSAQ
jgi:hypothetical protein